MNKISIFILINVISDTLWLSTLDSWLETRMKEIFKEIKNIQLRLRADVFLLIWIWTLLKLCLHNLNHSNFPFYNFILFPLDYFIKSVSLCVCLYKISDVTINYVIYRAARVFLKEIVIKSRISDHPWGKRLKSATGSGFPKPLDNPAFCQEGSA